MDNETRLYVDAKTEATRAQNDARFAEVLSSISSLRSSLEGQIAAIRPGMSWWQFASTLAGALAVTLGLVFGVLAFASDRFDGGLSAGAVVDEAVTVERAAQDARIGAILDALEARTSAPR